MKIEKEFPVGEKFIFVHSFPASSVSIVEILGYRDDGRHIYFRKESGGSDSTVADFLCPITGKIKEMLDKEEVTS